MASGPWYQGNIRSEGELNRVRWRIGATNNTYVVPFTTASGVKMPLTYQKTSAGSAAGSVVFSTFSHSSVAPPTRGTITCTARRT